MPTHHHRLLAAACASLMMLPAFAFTGTNTQPPTDDTQLIETIEKAEQTMRRYGVAEAPEKTPGAFRLTTYNIENLFDDIDDPALSGDDEDIDDTKPHHELLATARAIREVNADVLCLEEVESREALDWFVSTYIPDMGYKHIISLDAGNSRGIENAVLSRFPLSNPELWIGKELGGVHPDNYGPNAKNFYAGEPVAFRRSPLKVDVEIPGTDADATPWTLTLFVVHHKSGRYSGYWREAEAKTILKLTQQVEQEHPGRPIVILGDFNAQASDESVKIYLRDGFNDLFANAKPGDASTITHESNRRIDLMLLNEAAQSRLVDGSRFVFGTAARPEGFDWRELPSFDGYAADHYPVSAELRISN